MGVYIIWIYNHSNKMDNADFHLHQNSAKIELSPELFNLYICMHIIKIFFRNTMLL